MIYIGLLIIAGGFFITGYYFSQWRSFVRLKKFIGKPIDFNDVCRIINGGKP